MTELDAGVVATYVKDMKDKYEEVFTPFKKLCKSNKVSFVLAMMLGDVGIYCSGVVIVSSNFM